MRKAMRAARTEGDLEGERFTGALAEELAAAKARAAGKPRLVPVEDAPAIARLSPEQIPDLLQGADLGSGVEEHLPLLAQLIAEREASMRALQIGPSDVPRRVEVLWARANGTHLVWCERRHAATLAASALTREVICVAAVDKGKISERWSFG